METPCTRLSGRLRVLALIFGRTLPSLSPSPQPCRTPGTASVSDAVKQGLTRWWRMLPMRWPTGAASRGCGGERRNHGLRSRLGKSGRLRREPFVSLSSSRKALFLPHSFPNGRILPVSSETHCFVFVGQCACVCFYMSTGHLWLFLSPLRPEQAEHRSYGAFVALIHVYTQT